MKSSEIVRGYLKWECPVCGDVCEDPNDFRTTMCHNDHEVMLGHDRGDGWQEAHTPNSTLSEPSS